MKWKKVNIIQKCFFKNCQPEHNQVMVNKAAQNKDATCQPPLQLGMECDKVSDKEMGENGMV